MPICKNCGLTTISTFLNNDEYKICQFCGLRYDKKLKG
jgi:tRNA(Ile2) C34 agmatinyltransferase TiaS